MLLQRGSPYSTTNLFIHCSMNILIHPLINEYTHPRIHDDAGFCQCMRIDTRDAIRRCSQHLQGKYCDILIWRMSFAATIGHSTVLSSCAHLCSILTGLHYDVSRVYAHTHARTHTHTHTHIHTQVQEDLHGEVAASYTTHSPRNRGRVRHHDVPRSRQRRSPVLPHSLRLSVPWWYDYLCLNSVHDEYCLMGALLKVPASIFCKKFRIRYDLVSPIYSCASVLLCIAVAPLCCSCYCVSVALRVSTRCRHRDDSEQLQDDEPSGSFSVAALQAESCRSPWSVAPLWAHTVSHFEILSKTAEDLGLLQILKTRVLEA